jgi:putative RecB family exonuclease
MSPQYSHSKLSTFETCPLQYRFRYIDKIKVEREGVEAFMGKRVHEVLEKLYSDLAGSKLNTLDELLAYYNDQWESKWHEKVEIVKKQFDWKHYHAIGTKAIEDYYEHYKPFDQGKVLRTEDQFFFKIDDAGEYTLTGYIDRVDRAENGTIEIHDYKTSSRLPPQDKVDSDRQLALYQMAIEDKWPDVEKVSLIWHFLVFDKKLVSERTEDQLDDVREEVLTRIREIEGIEDFEAHESGLCPWCDYEEMCPARHPELGKQSKLEV